METHHPKLTHNKKWREYLAEFLMIFLAVTMGFFAESFREKRGDHEREEQYINSMKEDLKADTTALKKVIIFNERKLELIDSTLELLNSDIKHINRKKFYISCINLFSSQPFSFNDRTISQLKNTGGLRLISNQKVSDSITLYEQYNKTVNDENNVLKEHQLAMTDLFTKIIDFKLFKKYKPNELANVPDKEFVLYSSQENLNLLYNQCYYLQTVIKAYVQMLQGDQYFAEHLIDFLNKEY